MISAVRIANVIPLNFLSAHAIDAGGEGQAPKAKTQVRDLCEKAMVRVCFPLKTATIHS
jgi:hypothetical protein